MDFTLLQWLNDLLSSTYVTSLSLMSWMFFRMQLLESGIAGMNSAIRGQTNILLILLGASQKSTSRLMEVSLSLIPVLCTLAQSAFPSKIPIALKKISKIVAPEIQITTEEAAPIRLPGFVSEDAAELYRIDSDHE
jgi:hypothetical protein